MPDATAVVPTGTVVCPDGCCLEVEDPTLPRAPYRDRYARPMYEVLRPVEVGQPMRMAAEDYRPDGILL